MFLDKIKFEITMILYFVHCSLVYKYSDSDSVAKEEERQGNAYYRVEVEKTEFQSSKSVEVM